MATSHMSVIVNVWLCHSEHMVLFDWISSTQWPLVIIERLFAVPVGIVSSHGSLYSRASYGPGLVHEALVSDIK